MRLVFVLSIGFIFLDVASADAQEVNHSKSADGGGVPTGFFWSGSGTAASLGDDILIDEDELCTHPAKYACDTALNPYIEKEIKAFDDFNELKSAAQSDASITKFAKEKSQGKSNQCSQLSDEDWATCQKMINGLVENKVFTPMRKKKAEALFNKAKIAMLARLKDESLFLKASERPESESTLKEMIKKVEEAKIYFGTKRDDDPIAYSVEANRIAPPSERRGLKYYATLGGSALSNIVYLNGAITKVDSDPEDLYATLLHELSHFIDPGEFRKDANYTNNPFQKQLQCLKRSDSVGAKTGDANCFDRRAKKYDKTDAYTAADCRKTASKIRSNPDTSWQKPRLDDGDDCQMGQLGEAFADWFASEAWVKESMSELDRVAQIDGKADIREQTSGKHRIDLTKRFSRLPKFLESIAGLCNSMRIQPWDEEGDITYDSHPLDRARLERIFLAHPTIRFALGCSPNNIFNARSTTVEADADRKYLPAGAKVYCGQHLYLPFGAK